jgi:hypothetical protein
MKKSTKEDRSDPVGRGLPLVKSTPEAAAVTFCGIRHLLLCKNGEAEKGLPVPFPFTFPYTKRLTGFSAIASQKIFISSRTKSKQYPTFCQEEKFGMRILGKIRRIFSKRIFSLTRSIDSGK